MNLTLANYRGQETPDRQSGAGTSEDNRLQQQKTTVREGKRQKVVTLKDTNLEQKKKQS